MTPEVPRRIIRRNVPNETLFAMESPERAAVRDALAILQPYLEAYVASIVGEAKLKVAKVGPPRSGAVVDVSELVNQIVRRWDDLFAHHLPRGTRSYLYELRDIRNRWAHEEPFSTEDVERAFSTIRLVGRAIGAPDFQLTMPRQLRMPSRLRSTPRASAQRWPSQRALMRELMARYGGDMELVIQEYAAAERRGEVERKQNASGLTPEGYARALYADGVKKGWLREQQ